LQKKESVVELLGENNMIYHDQNKEDNKMLNDLENSDKELRARDSIEREDSMFDPCTMHEVMIPSDTTFRRPERMLNDTTFKQSEYGTSLFQTGVHLSRIDSQTGYDDYDPRDLNPDSIYVSHDIGSIPRARLLTDNATNNTTLYPDTTDSTLCPEPKLSTLTILQDARERLIDSKQFNSIAYWFLCDAINYVIMGGKL
jgi:hypothetical protein